MSHFKLALSLFLVNNPQRVNVPQEPKQKYLTYNIKAGIHVFWGFPL